MEIEARAPRLYVICLATTITALATVVGSAVPLMRDSGRLTDPAVGLLALVLAIAVVASYLFPIHVQVSSKVYMSSAALFLLAALLPPPIAALAAAVGVVIGELRIRSKTGNPLAAIATCGARIALIVTVGSLVIQAPLPSGFQLPWLLVAGACVMWIGDIVTLPLLHWPINRESPVRVMRMALQSAGLAEAAQYLVGLLGAVEASKGLWVLGLLVLPTAFIYVAFKNTKEMHDETQRILEQMADMVDERDPYTDGHQRRVKDFSLQILKELGKSGPEVRLVTSAARVHDIGKIGIPDAVLLKEGALTDEEWEVMKSHAERGADLLARYPDFGRGVDIIRHHHEAWDGSGYPHGLSGSGIPFGARVIAVADTYDALTSDRPYRKGCTAAKAAQILREGSGRQWDAQIVSAFLRARKLEAVEPAPEISSAVPRRATAQAFAS